MRRGIDRKFTLHWADDQAPNLGEGVSRTSKAAASLWEVHIGFGSSRPMKEWLRAMNHGQARKFARNRHPSATTITVIGKQNGPII